MKIYRILLIGNRKIFLFLYENFYFRYVSLHTTTSEGL